MNIEQEIQSTCLSPDCDNQKVPHPGKASSTHAPPAEQVCIIGGHRLVRFAIEGLLQRRGHRTTGCFGNFEAFTMQLSRDNAPDVAVVLLTGKNGDDLDPLRQVAANKQVNLVILGQHLSHSVIQAALRVGVKGIVNMDCSTSELTHAIRLAAAGKVYLSTEATELLIGELGRSGRSGRPRDGLGLSRREIEVVTLLCEGLSNKQIGKELHISTKTVENHRYSIYRKCGIDNIAGLVRHAVRTGIVSIT